MATAILALCKPNLYSCVYDCAHACYSCVYHDCVPCLSAQLPQC